MEKHGREGKEEQDKLHRQFTHLEQEWDSIKESRPRTRCRSLSDSNTILRALQFLENSPRSLMSVLQRGMSPVEGVGEWKVRTNDMAVVEILTERRAAIKSGKLKGRQLFASPYESSNEMDIAGREEIPCHAVDGCPQEREVRSVTSYDSDDENGNPESEGSSCSLVCDECIERLVMAEEEKKAVVGSVPEEKKCFTGVNGCIRRTLTVFWVAIGLILSAVAVKISGGHRHGHEEMITLVPT